MNYLVIYLISENWTANILWTQTKPGSAFFLFLCNSSSKQNRTANILWTQTKPGSAITSFLWNQAQNNYDFLISLSRTPFRQSMICNYCSIWIYIPGLGSVSAVGSYLSKIILYFSFRVLLHFSREVHGTTFQPCFHGSWLLMLSIWCSLYVYTRIESWKNPLQHPSRKYRGFPFRFLSVLSFWTFCRSSCFQNSLSRKKDTMCKTKVLLWSII